MKREQTQEVMRSLSKLTEAPEQFVNHTPRLKRTEADRQSLLDAITRAQLVLSLHRLPTNEEEPSSPFRSKLRPAKRPGSAD